MGTFTQKALKTSNLNRFEGFFVSPDVDALDVDALERLGIAFTKTQFLRSVQGHHLSCQPSTVKPQSPNRMQNQPKNAAFSKKSSCRLMDAKNMDHFVPEQSQRPHPGATAR